MDTKAGTAAGAMSHIMGVWVMGYVMAANKIQKTVFGMDLIVSLMHFQMEFVMVANT